MLEVIKTIEKGPVLIRFMRMDGACGPHRSHAHNYDHTTCVFEGLVQVICHDETGDEPLGILGPTDMCLIKAGREHTVIPLEPSVYGCMYPHRDEDLVLCEVYRGVPEAYQ